MSSTLHRLRRRMSMKKRHSGTSIKENSEHCLTPDTEIMHVSVEHVGDDAATQRELTITTSDESANAAPAAALPSNNSEAEGAADVNDAANDNITPAPAATPTSNEKGKQLFQQQLPLISPREEAEEALSMPSITAYSTVNYFEPSVEENNVDAHTYACDKMNPIPTQAQKPKEISQLQRSSNFGIIEINVDDMDDVSDIENPEPLPFQEEENNVCFQVFNESLCTSKTNTNQLSDQMDDNDLISLPHLTVVTPEDGEKSRGRNTSTRRSSRSHKTHDESFQTYIEDSYNDIIQALTNSTKECGLTDTLDEIRNGLFQ